MADRNLSTTLEQRNEDGPYWRLKIDRSASGQPALFFTIQTESFSVHDRGIEALNREMTFVAEDAWAALAAPLAWLLDATTVDAIFDDQDNLNGYDRATVDNVLRSMVAWAQKKVVA